MRKYVALVGLLLLTAGAALAQEFPKVETSPAFMASRAIEAGTAKLTASPARARSKRTFIVVSRSLD